jgi:hypothetical protein
VLVALFVPPQLPGVPSSGVLSRQMTPAPLGSTVGDCTSVSHSAKSLVATCAAVQLTLM